MNREQLVQWVYCHISGIDYHSSDIEVVRSSSIYANCCGSGNKKLKSRHGDLLTLVVL